MTDLLKLAEENDALAERVPKDLGYILQGEICDGLTTSAAALREAHEKIRILDSALDTLNDDCNELRAALEPQK